MNAVFNTPNSSNTPSSLSSIFENSPECSNPESFVSGAKTSLKQKLKKYSRTSLFSYKSSSSSIDEVLESPTRNLYKKGSDKIKNLFQKSRKPRFELSPTTLHKSAGQLLEYLQSLKISPETSAGDLELLLAAKAEEQMKHESSDFSFYTVKKEIKRSLTPISVKKTKLQKLFDAGTATKKSYNKKIETELDQAAETTLYDRALMLKESTNYQKPPTNTDIGSLDLAAPEYSELLTFFAGLSVIYLTGRKPCAADFQQPKE